MKRNKLIAIFIILQIILICNPVAILAYSPYLGDGDIMIPLSYCSINNNPVSRDEHPSRMPSRMAGPPIKLYYNANNKCLTFINNEEDVYYYSILDDNGTELLNGQNLGNSSIAISSMLNNTYTIKVTIDGLTYEGTIYN